MRLFSTISHYLHLNTDIGRSHSSLSSLDFGSQLFEGYLIRLISTFDHPHNGWWVPRTLSHCLQRQHCFLWLEWAPGKRVAYFILRWSHNKSHLGCKLSKVRRGKERILYTCTTLNIKESILRSTGTTATLEGSTRFTDSKNGTW